MGRVFGAVCTGARLGGATSTWLPIIWCNTGRNRSLSHTSEPPPPHTTHHHTTTAAWRRQRRLRSMPRHERQTVAMALARGEGQGGRGGGASFLRRLAGTEDSCTAGAGCLEEPAPQRSARSQRQSAGDAPLLVVASLAGGDEVDAITISYLLRVNLERKKKEGGGGEDRRRGLRRRGRSGSSWSTNAPARPTTGTSGYLRPIGSLHCPLHRPQRPWPSLAGAGGEAVDRGALLALTEEAEDVGGQPQDWHPLLGRGGRGRRRGRRSFQKLLPPAKSGHFSSSPSTVTSCWVSASCLRSTGIGGFWKNFSHFLCASGARGAQGNWTFLGDDSWYSGYMHGVSLPVQRPWRFHRCSSWFGMPVVVHNRKVQTVQKTVVFCACRL